MDETFDAGFEFDECAVAGEVANLAFDLAAGLVFLAGAVPRIDFELANTELDFLFFAVDAKHDGFDFLVGFEDVGWLGNAFGPGEFGDVNEAFDTGL